MSENRIKIIDIVEKIKNGTDSAFEGIEIKGYVPVSTKKLMCEEIATNSIVEHDGLKMKDSIAYEIALSLMIVSFYTNIDIDEHYDEACEYGIIDFIKENMNQKELEFIEQHSWRMIESEISIYNSIAGVINRNLQELVNKIPTNKDLNKLIKTVSKEFQKFDPDKMKQIQEMMKVVK